MSYKDAWNARYMELAFEMFGCEYYECTEEQRKQLDEAISAWSSDYAANLADALKDKLKYGEIT